MARPKIVIDIKQLETLAAMNCTVDEIAAVLNVDRTVIFRRYATQIEKARGTGKASLKRRMWQCAMGYKDLRTIMVKVKRTTTGPDGEKVIEETSEPKTVELTMEPNTGMQQWLSKQMLGYSDKVDSRVDERQTRVVEHKWVLKTPAGKEKEVHPEAVGNDLKHLYDQQD